jgi:hypothetical protein
MIPQPRQDEEIPEIDVKYGIAGCRKRLRSQRATLRALHQTPTDVPSCASELAGLEIKGYAEILGVPIRQQSGPRLPMYLPGPASDHVWVAEEKEEEAAKT